MLGLWPAWDNSLNISCYQWWSKGCWRRNFETDPSLHFVEEICMLTWVSNCLSMISKLRFWIIWWFPFCHWTLWVELSSNLERKVNFVTTLPFFKVQHSAANRVQRQDLITLTHVTRYFKEYSDGVKDFQSWFFLVTLINEEAHVKICVV